MVFAEYPYVFGCSRSVSGSDQIEALQEKPILVGTVVHKLRTRCEEEDILILAACPSELVENTEKSCRKGTDIYYLKCFFIRHVDVCGVHHEKCFFSSVHKSLQPIRKLLSHPDLETSLTPEHLLASFANSHLPTTYTSIKNESETKPLARTLRTVGVAREHVFGFH